MVPPRCAAMAVNVYSLVRVVVTGSPVAVDVRVTVSSICSSISINFKVCNSTQKRLAWYSTSEQVAAVLRVVRGASCTATAHLLRCKRPKCVRAGTVGICPRRLKVYDRTLRYKVKCDAAQCARIGLFGVVGVKTTGCTTLEKALDRLLDRFPDVCRNCITNTHSRISVTCASGAHHKPGVLRKTGLKVALRLHSRPKTVMFTNLHATTLVNFLDAPPDSSTNVLDTQCTHTKHTHTHACTTAASKRTVTLAAAIPQNTLLAADDA